MEPSTPESPLIDPRHLQTFIILGRADYDDFLGDMIVEVPAQLEHIQAAIQQQNPASFKTHTHSLRGILAYFGCVTMTTRLAQLENQECPAPELASPIHSELLSLWQSSLAAINQWANSQPDFSP